MNRYTDVSIFGSSFEKFQYPIYIFKMVKHYYQNPNHYSRNTVHRGRRSFVSENKNALRRMNNAQKSANLYSCHNNAIINDVRECKPSPQISHLHHKSRTVHRSCKRMPNVVFTVMNKRDVNSCIRNFLYLWPHLKEYNVSVLKRFVTSQHSFVHQDHVDLFIHLYTPAIRNELFGINYRDVQL